MPGYPWTDDELAILADTSLTLREVAQRTGRSVQACGSRAAREGIDRRAGDWSPLEDNAIRAAIRNAARALGRSERAIARRAVTLTRDG